MQRKLAVGHAHDPLEDAADHAADLAMRLIRSGDASGGGLGADADRAVDGYADSDVDHQASAHDGSVVRIARSALRRALATPADSSDPGSIEGGELDAATERSIAAAQGGGAPLPGGIRRQFEGAFGADFGAVRVHTDPGARAISRQLNAKAFTLGSDIFFGQSENLASEGGMRLLGHELAHTVQQGGDAAGQAQHAIDPPAQRAVDPVLRRDIGFELETRTLMSKRKHGGAALPAGGFVDANAGGAAFSDVTNTPMVKGEALLKGPNVGAVPDIEVQADDATGGTDIEVVLTHFPEDAAGRVRLDTAMTDLDTLVAAHDVLAAAAGYVVPAVALNGVGNFVTHDADTMIAGRWSTATTAPQVTMGIRVENVPNIVRDLHGSPGESDHAKADRDPGRMRMRSPKMGAVPPEPRDLGAGEEAQTLINGNQLAKQAIGAYQAIDHTAPMGPALEGFLTIIFTYAEGAQHKMAFLKSHTPLMAKTDMATIWDTLPQGVRDYYGETHKGKTNFEALMETQAGYPARMLQPVFDVAGGHAFVEGTSTAPVQWYHRLTLRDWVRAVTVHRNPTKAEAFKEFFGTAQLRGVDQLSSANFPGKPAGQQVEGYAALGQNMDTHAATGDRLPVFELRSASRPITFAAAHQWVLHMFDYIVSLNTHPGGGYQRIV